LPKTLFQVSFASETASRQPFGDAARRLDPFPLARTMPFFAPVWASQGWRSHREAAGAKRTSLTCPNRETQLKQAFGEGIAITKAFQDVAFSQDAVVQPS
jgi:hypothetical protein